MNPTGNNIKRQMKVREEKKKKTKRGEGKGNRSKGYGKKESYAANER